MKKYIYQFTLRPVTLLGRFDLLFSEEIDDDNIMSSESSLIYQSPVFAVKESEIYDENLVFPGEINGEFIDFKLRLNNNGFELHDNRLEVKLDFRIYPLWTDDILFKWKAPFINNQLEFFTYGGKFTNIKSKDKTDFFKILIPQDLIIMDYLYHKIKFCLVGYTPTYIESRK